MKRICEVGRTAWCEKDVVSAGLIVDAESYYKAFFDAARLARRTLLISGWQFDSEVPLLRGEDAAAAEREGWPVTLKAFLNTLCERSPELEIRMLAWDFNVIFAFEREWMQSLLFDWTTHERLLFELDSNHVDMGSHHQKFVVVDGGLTFLGGLDLCDHRWDTRAHRDEEPLRVSRGSPHKPFHDIQAYLVGREPAAALEELFVCRWKLAGGKPFELGGERFAVPSEYHPRGALVVDTRSVALSRTDPKSSPCPDPENVEPCREVVELYLAAIGAAEHHIYVETQYFSSHAIAEALVRRLRDASRPALEVVLVLNMRAETLKEEVAVGLAQAKVLADLREAARGTPHQLGIYYTTPDKEGTEEPSRATYIHAKLMIVDDRILNIGSANLTNRSTGVDTELNATFEACSDDASRDEALRASIEAIRLDLLREHLGAPSPITPAEATVASLDAHASRRNGRMRLHPSPTDREKQALDVIDPQALPFDPEGTEDEDEERRSLFVRGIGSLWRRLVSDRDDTK